MSTRVKIYDEHGDVVRFWNHVLKSHPNYADLRLYLKTQKIKVIKENIKIDSFCVEFPTEEDAIAFVLKWS